LSSFFVIIKFSDLFMNSHYGTLLDDGYPRLVYPLSLKVSLAPGYVIPT